jgi:hypothetical protein
MKLPMWIHKWLNGRKPPAPLALDMRLEPGASACMRLPPELEETLSLYLEQGRSVTVEHGGIIRDGDQCCRHVLVKADGLEIASIELHWALEPGSVVGKGLMMELQAFKTIRQEMSRGQE